MTRKRVLIVLFVLVINLLVIAGIYLWQNLVFTGERRAVTNTPHHFIVQGGVLEDDLALVEEGLTLATRYFSSQLGTTLPDPVEIRMAQTTPCIPFQPLGSSSTAVADKSMMCVDTISYVWTEVVPENRLIGLSIIAHEHFHNLQGQLGCLPGPNNHEYAWWVEGSATYVGWQTLVEAGMVSEVDVEETMRDWGGFSDGLLPLTNYERRMPGDPEYALAYRAIVDLVDRAGTAESLSQFCRRIGEGENWRTAFEQTYNLSVEEFYTAFEEARQS